VTIKLVLFNSLPTEEDRKVNTETRSCKYCCHGKDIGIKYYKFTVFCLIKPERRMGCILLSYVGRMTVPDVPLYLINGTIFRQNKLLKIKYFSISLKTFCPKYFSV
jgi:hypothetical protein